MSSRGFLSKRNSRAARKARLAVVENDSVCQE
jgi:hypothetical protein